MAKSLIPKSIPIVLLSLIVFFCGIISFVSTNIEAKYFPVGVTLMLVLFIFPSIGLCKIISIPSLNLGITKKLFSKRTFCGIEKDCLPLCFDLNLGNPAPLKNFLKVMSIFCIDYCRDWLFTSFNHSHSFLSSGSCLIKSKGEKLCLETKYALFLVSRARLYTNLLLPICLAINSFCESVGEILYFNPLSNRTKIQHYFDKTKDFV